MLVSLVILTWNRCRFLEQCLSAMVSRLSHRYEYEILVLNNGSNDATTTVLETFKASRTDVTIVTRTRNGGLSAYKPLFARAKGQYIVEIDDDILEFPDGFDATLVDYLETYPDYGYLALNVVQDERTNGAKPEPSLYVADERGDRCVEQGPTGGWCTAFRRCDYRRIRLLFNLVPLSMRRCEDGMLATLFRRLLGLKSGVIRDAVCLHACGPHFARLYGQTEREVEKYLAAGLTKIAESYLSTRTTHRGGGAE